MANTETIETKKATALEENTDVADADLFLVGNAGTSVLRKLKWSNILAAVKKKLSKVASSGSYNDLEDKPGVVSTKADGLAPKRGGTTTKFLRDDGTWAVPPDNDTKPVGMKGATTSAAGSAGYAPAPAAGAANRYLRSDGTWQVPPDNNTTYGNMKGATTSAAGGAGLAPAPAAGAANRYLRSDGTWQVPPDHDTVYSHPDEHPASMITQDATHRFVSDTEKSTWNGKMNTTGNGSNLTAAFSQAASRTNLTSGEKLSILLGKIAKWFADLKAHAFSDLIQNATSTSTTQAVSAAVAKNLQDQITAQNTNTELINYDAVTATISVAPNKLTSVCNKWLEKGTYVITSNIRTTLTKQALLEGHIFIDGTESTRGSCYLNLPSGQQQLTHTYVITIDQTSSNVVLQTRQNTGDTVEITGWLQITRIHG